MSKPRKNPCAFEEAGWTQDAVSLQCSSPRDVYHCISNEKDRLVKLCIQPVWVNPSKYKNIFVTLYEIIVPFFLINSFLCLKFYPYKSDFDLFVCTQSCLFFADYQNEMEIETKPKPKHWTSVFNTVTGVFT